MRKTICSKFVAGIFLSLAVAVMSQDRGAEVGASGSPPPDFASLEPFVRGLAMANREVAVYRVRAATLPSHRYPKPIVIVWTKEGIVAEQKDGAASTKPVRLASAKLMYTLVEQPTRFTLSKGHCTSRWSS